MKDVSLFPTDLLVAVSALVLLGHAEAPHLRAQLPHLGHRHSVLAQAGRQGGILDGGISSCVPYVSYVRSSSRKICKVRDTFNKLRGAQAGSPGLLVFCHP